MNSVVDRSRDIGPFVPQPDDGMLVCRCEEVTKGEIRQAVHDGLWTMAEVRRFLRCGMGLCQGQTCGKLVKSILARELGVSPDDLEPATSRSPMRPIELQIFANEVEADEPAPHAPAGEDATTPASEDTTAPASEAGAAAGTAATTSANSQTQKEGGSNE